MKIMKPHLCTGLLKRNSPTYDNSQGNYSGKNFLNKVSEDSTKGVLLEISKFFRILLNGCFCIYKNLADKNMFKVRDIFRLLPNI